ncbi:hypothetical protein [Pirellulimonas nuda]|uniref:hypothetical protein n=1 Tax=Pirellulimonas nuda TaxID=2528009 RepID=UPI001E298495|nr:hypothetical protein [Pirellulimonas nuda]
MVPVGGIVFAEHFLFPRIGLTRYWAKYRGLKHSTPAVASWAAGLAFGFGLNYLQVMSFFYLFLPTWAFTIVLYTILASRYGARERYPAEEGAERARSEAIKDYQRQQALAQSPPVHDRSALTYILRGTKWLALAATLILALVVMFRSPDMPAYQRNADVFYPWGFALTIIYFASAYWVLQRTTRLNKAKA